MKAFKALNALKAFKAFWVFQVGDILEGQKGDQGGGPKMAKIQYGAKPDIFRITKMSKSTLQLLLSCYFRAFDPVLEQLILTSVELNGRRKRV